MSKPVMIKYVIVCNVCGEIIGYVSMPVAATTKQIENAISGYICESCAIGVVV